MTNQNSNKGNPAHKRMANPRHAATRAASWKRGEARKAARRAAQEARHQVNVEGAQRGILSPHKQHNVDNIGRKEPKVAPSRPALPVLSLESVRDRHGVVTGWRVVRYFGGVSQRTLRVHESYEQQRLFLEIA